MSFSTFVVDSNCPKIFRFVAQSPCSRIGVSVVLQRIRHQIEKDCAGTALQAYGDLSETLANARTLRCESIILMQMTFLIVL